MGKRITIRGGTRITYNDNGHRRTATVKVMYAGLAIIQPEGVNTKGAPLGAHMMPVEKLTPCVD